MDSGVDSRFGSAVLGSRHPGHAKVRTETEKRSRTLGLK